MAGRAGARLSNGQSHVTRVVYRRRLYRGGETAYYTTADPVTVTTTGTLPAPLLINTYYYVRVLSSTTFTLHDTAAHASATQ